MIVEGLCNLLALPLLGIISLLPQINITIPTDILSWFSNLLSFCSWFFPVGDFLLMLGIWLVVTNFNIIWKIITRIWDALPFT